MVAGLDALFAVYAFILVPYKPALQGVDFMPCAVRDAAHRDILTCAAEAAGAVSLDMGKIDEKIRVINQSRDVDMLEFLEIDFLRIIIFAEVAAVVEHRTSERRFRIAAAFGMAAVDIVVGDEAFRPVFVEEIHKLHDEYRRNRRIGNARPDVHFHRYGLALHLFRKTGPFKKSCKLLRKRLRRLIPCERHRCKQNFFCHMILLPPLSAAIL